MKEYSLITSSLLIFLTIVQRMVTENDGLSHLDPLLQKSLRYKYHINIQIYRKIEQYSKKCRREASESAFIGIR